MAQNLPRKIVKLSEDVINRIAAGEVVQRPANAIKELMENSLDAGAKNIQISIKNGGLKVLQIQDDGSGINKEDLPILCERFTTSKLAKFEDLETISTYGFRGEALASISHVSYLTITTKTKDSICAYSAKYTDGKLRVFPDGTQNPKPVAGNQGTIVLAEDLFYNMDTRRRALKPADEHNKVLSVVTQYAVHNPTVGFLVRKHGETGVEVRTPKDSSTLSNIQILYGGQISRELVEVELDDELFKLRGYISNANYSTRKCISILFINHRLVESSAIRKAIESVYSLHLPKNGHPFLYISLEINPRNVDVNVHPTKSEVHFLHEDIIISKMSSYIEAKLQNASHSRAFYVQTVLPGSVSASVPANASSVSKNYLEKQVFEKRATTKTLFSGSSQSQSSDPRKMVRTDAKLQKLEKFFCSTPTNSLQEGNGNKSGEISGLQWNESPVEADSQDVDNMIAGKRQDFFVPTQSSGCTRQSQGSKSSTKKRNLRLKSIYCLIQKVKADRHNVLQDLFQNHTFVGCVDRTRAIIQHETSIYMVHTTRVSVELFYQAILADFGNFGRISITSPHQISTLVKNLATRNENGDETSDSVSDEAKQVEQLLLAKKDMLDDYFGIKIDDEGYLISLPLLLDKYVPDLLRLPEYLWNISKDVDWNNEEACFQTLAHQTALFYAVPPGDDDANDELTLTGNTWKWTIEHVLYPEIKKALVPPTSFAEDTTVFELAKLADLYKVFERC